MIISIDKYKKTGGGGDAKPTEVLKQTITENGSQTFKPKEGYVFSSASITTNIHPTEKLTATIKDNGVATFGGEYAGAEITVDVETFTPEGNFDITENGTYDIANYATTSVNVQGSSTTIIDRGEISTEELIEEALRDDKQYTYIWEGEGALLSNILLKYSDTIIPRLEGGNYDGAFPEVYYNSDTDAYEEILDNGANPIRTLYPIAYVTDYMPKIYGQDAEYHWSGLKSGLVLWNESYNTVNNMYYGRLGFPDQYGSYVQNNTNISSYSVSLQDKYGSSVYYYDASNPYSDKGYINGNQMVIKSGYGYGTYIASLNKFVYTGTDDIMWYKEFNSSPAVVKDEFVNLNNVKLAPININKNNSRFYCKYSLPIDVTLDFTRTGNYSSYISFLDCKSIKSITINDTTNDTYDESIWFEFGGCEALTRIEFVSNKLIGHGVTQLSNTFGACNSLTSIPLLDASKVTAVYDVFGYNKNTTLTDLGGFKNLSVSITSNFLDLCPNLTVESLMNVINNLANVSGQSLKFGSTNLNKLTADQIAIATAKGWTLTA